MKCPKCRCETSAIKKSGCDNYECSSCGYKWYIDGNGDITLGKNLN